jgi:hypothetical protein
VAQAAATYLESGGRPCRLDVVFTHNTDFRKRDAVDYARVLSTLVPKRLRDRAEPASLRPIRRRKPWPAWLSNIYVAPPLPCLQGEHRWEAVHGGTELPSGRLLQQALDEKEQKLATYRESGCGEYWLLITISGRSAASFIASPEPAETFRSSFDRVIVFWRDTRCYVDLEVHTASHG